MIGQLYTVKTRGRFEGVGSVEYQTFIITAASQDDVRAKI